MTPAVDFYTSFSLCFFVIGDKLTKEVLLADVPLSSPISDPSLLPLLCPHGGSSLFHRRPRALQKSSCPTLLIPKPTIPPLRCVSPFFLYQNKLKLRLCRQPISTPRFLETSALHVEASLSCSLIPPQLPLERSLEVLLTTPASFLSFFRSRVSPIISFFPL